MGRIRLDYTANEPRGFCGRIHIKRRYSRFGQLRYRVKVQQPGFSGPGVYGATEPARNPHPIGGLCFCQTSGAVATFRVTFIADFYRQHRHKFLAKATVSAVIP